MQSRNMAALTLVIVCILLVLPPLMRAQQTVTSATPSGRIEDASGALLSGASVSATNQQTNQTQTATTNFDGRFRFPYLQVGNYKLSIEARGFAPWTKQLTVTVGQTI